MGYIVIRKIDDYENIHSVNPLYLIIGKLNVHTECNSVEEKSGSKYLVFDFTDGNKEVFKNTQNLG